MTLFREQFRIESTRYSGWNYGSPGWYFATMCTKGRMCTLGNAIDSRVVLSEAGHIAKEEMLRIVDRYSNVKVDCYVVMPNHVHALIVIEGRHTWTPQDGASPVSTKKIAARSIADVVGGYKSGVSRICRLHGIRAFAWQTRFYDRILSSNAAVNAVREYIEQNPKNWVGDPEHV